MNLNSYKFIHNRIKCFLTKNKANAIVLFSNQNIFWVTGLKTSDGIVLVSKTKTYLFVDARDYEFCKKHVKYCEIVLFKTIKDLHDLIKKLNIKILLCEKDYLTLKQKENFLTLKNIKVVPADTISLRIIKTNEEIAVLKQSANIALKSINEVKKWIKIGMTELQVAHHIHNYMISLGANNVSFDLIVAFGKNTSNPHHQPTNDKLKNNQMITCDIGCIYNGYCSDITRTFFIGKPTKQQQKMYDLVLSAQKLGLTKIKAGIKSNDLDGIVRKYICLNKQWGNLFVHSLGHGVGIDIHEPPFLSPKTNTILNKNMVVTIEPGVYQPNFGGVRIEDTVVVTKNGCINLTSKASKRFII